MAAAVLKVDPAKRNHRQTRIPIHVPRFSMALNASMEKELVNQLQVAEAAEESRKKAKK